MATDTDISPEDSTQSDCSDKPEATPKELSKKKQSRADFLKKAREKAGFEFQWFLNFRYDRRTLIFDTTSGPIRARIKRFGIFGFTLTIKYQEEPVDLDKLQTFTIFEAKYQDRLAGHLKTHQPTKERGLVPQPKGDLKARIPDNLVTESIASEKQLALMLMNGTIIIGVPIKESVYSLLFKVPDLATGHEIFVFKHGILGLKLFDDINPNRVEKTTP